MDMNMQTFEELQRHQLVTEFDIQSQSELDDYQVKLDNVDNPTQAQDNLIVDNNGKSLPHWNESLDFDTWIKTDIGVSGIRGILIHGNDGLVSESNGIDVFIVFDDFEDASQGDWTTLGGAVSYNNTDQAYGGSQSMKLSASGRAEIPITASDNIIIEYQLWKKNSANFYFWHSDTIWTAHCGFPSSENIEYYTTSWQDTGDDIVADQWELMSFGNFDWTGHTYDITRNEVQSQNDAGMWNYGVRAQDEVELQNDTGDDVYIDNFIVRKYAAIEPTIQIGSPKNISTALKSFGRTG